MKKGDEALARYISKDVDESRLALETLDSRFKISFNGLSFHQLFLRAYEGDERALRLYRYFLSTMKGRKPRFKPLSFSSGQCYGLEVS